MESKFGRQRHFSKRRTTRTRNATKNPASLIDELQGMDLLSLLMQIENVQTNHLIVPQHQQEVNTKKGALKTRLNAL